jgi:hypothetical protein
MVEGANLPIAGYFLFAFVVVVCRVLLPNSILGCGGLIVSGGLVVDNDPGVLLVFYILAFYLAIYQYFWTPCLWMRVATTVMYMWILWRWLPLHLIPGTKQSSGADTTRLTAGEKKAIIVTGAASGIGRETVLKLAALDNVVIFACDLNKDMLDQLPTRNNVQLCPMDVTAAADCENLKSKGRDYLIKHQQN